MKFAKQLEQDLVPEWRIKYLNYKAGKKYVKAVSRAINRANGSPQGNGSKTDNRIASNFFHVSPFKHGSTKATNPDERTSLREGSAPVGSARQKAATPARAIPSSAHDGDRNLTNGPNDMQYGSFVHTPPQHEGTPLDRKPTFELPGPAMKVPSAASEATPQVAQAHGSMTARQALQRSASMIADPRNADPPSPEHTRTPSTLRLPHPATVGPGYGASPRGGLRRLFSNASPLNRAGTNPEYGLQGLALDVVRQKEKEFFEFLDSELDKVEAFYKMKEDQAGERLTVLKEQLHEMRNRRTQELHAQKRQAEIEYMSGTNGDSDDAKRGPLGWMDPVRSKIFKPGPNSRALQKMARTPVMAPREGHDAGRDYIRRPPEHEVPYRSAKRKLKLALQEFYRGLELLKSYALLNRTAFRKLNKKYDKAVNARPQYRYMNEKVNKSWFVNSDALDGHIKAVEDLYARYFERGNHKLAAGKLRSMARKPRDESGSAFRCGILLGTGAVFAIQGAVFGVNLLWDDDDKVRQQTSYLLQLYGGYFLMLLLFCMFCINCAIWTRNKINYPFIFEFDTRNNLDWRQLAEFPSLFTFIFGLFIWLNFSEYGTEEMYEYYPVALIFVSVLIIFFPAPLLKHRSRKWFAYAHWRLLLAGLYPVEFRDFFLGDIYCSLTYAMCNVELFFCIYANAWENPVQCNSNHSRLLGFLGALPPIWRFLQCLRRYRDTRNIFPHLVNGGKYTMSILAAMALSLYRINNTRGNLAMFIAFSTINAVYTSLWDLFMDFSLMQAQYNFLREIRALKKRWPYYLIMVLDPILRFAWIFYAIFTHDTQHSTIVSFMVALAEVSRRGMWTLFRVENEHCANVKIYKASRDVPLPYPTSPPFSRSPTVAGVAKDDDEVAETTAPVRETATAAATASGTSQRLEEGAVRQRKPSTILNRSFSKILAEAHRQDFEKRRKPIEADEPQLEEAGGMASDDDDGSDDDDDDEGDIGSPGSRADSMEIREAADLADDGREGTRSGP